MSCNHIYQCNHADIVWHHWPIGCPMGTMLIDRCICCGGVREGSRETSPDLHFRGKPVSEISYRKEDEPEGWVKVQYALSLWKAYNDSGTKTLSPFLVEQYDRLLSNTLDSLTRNESVALVWLAGELYNGTPDPLLLTRRLTGWNGN